MKGDLTVLTTPETALGPVVVTLGTFDGVHVGHREILRNVVDRARAANARSLVVTFDPHPLEIVDASRAPRLLDNSQERLSHIASLGIDFAYKIPFDATIAQQPPQTFLQTHLFSWLDIQEIIVGYDFHFGKARTGDARFLAETGEAHGFRVDVVPPVRLFGGIVSSTRIRKLVDGGEVSDAAQLLDRPFQLTGTVVAGDGRGRELGFPTANITLCPDQAKKLQPNRGVYAVRVHGPSEKPVDGMLNHGTRPTFDGSREQFEVDLFDHESSLYGATLGIDFCARVRDERRFESAAALREQLARDEDVCRLALQSTAT